jgi:ABC-type dipeptide/oligopeptide/nickel transport system permease subunit
VFTRRIARGWWWAAALGIALWLMVACFELYGVRRRQSPL